MGILFILNGKIHSIQKKGIKINMYICSYGLLVFLQSSTSSPHINPEILTHQCSKGDDLEYTLHGEEGSKHYVQVG